MMTFEALLPALAGKLGAKSLALDADNSILMSFDQSRLVYFKVNREEKSIQVVLPIPEVTLDLIGHMSVILYLYDRFSHASQLNVGYSMCYSEVTECMVIWRTFRDKFDGAEEILGIIAKIMSVGDMVVTCVPDMQQCVREEKEKQGSMADQPTEDDWRVKIGLLARYI